MKIYELRVCDSNQLEAELDEKHSRAMENLQSMVLGGSYLYTSLERAQIAAEEIAEETYLENLEQEEIDSEEVSNVCDDLEWIEEDGHWVAENEALGLAFIIREVEVTG